MKKILKLIIVIFPFLFFSCFEFVGSGTAKRTLQLTLAAPGDVAKLHIGVFEGSITPETMLYNNTVAAGSSIPLDLPSGTNRFIVVWAEGYDGIANYYGSIGPITISEDGNTPLPIKMVKFSSTQAYNGQYTDPNLYWDAIPGALIYQVDLYNANMGTWNIFAITSGTVYNIDYRSVTARISVSSSVFGLSSDPSPNIL